MIGDADIEKLAQLSRIDITLAERESLRKDIEAILSYVSDIEKAPTENISGEPSYMKLTNVMREDGDAYAPETFSEALLEEAPARDGALVKVKQILSQK